MAYPKVLLLFLNHSDYTSIVWLIVLLLQRLDGEVLHLQHSFKKQCDSILHVTVAVFLFYSHMHFLPAILQPLFL